MDDRERLESLVKNLNRYGGFSEDQLPAIEFHPRLLHPALAPRPAASVSAASRCRPPASTMRASIAMKALRERSSSKPRPRCSRIEALARLGDDAGARTLAQRFSPSTLTVPTCGAFVRSSEKIRSRIHRQPAPEVHPCRFERASENPTAKRSRRVVVTGRGRPTYGASVT
jgi:hypothetical protein